MATITKRPRANGTVVYRAEIVIKKSGVIVHRDSKTFDKAKLARDWAARREIELQESSVYQKNAFLPLSKVIEEYIKQFKPQGRSKVFDLNKLQTRDIARLDVNTLTARDLIKHVRERNKECQPQTANNDLIWIGTVIRTMSGVISINTNMGIFDAAREVLRREGLIAKSSSRERLPTKDELWKLSRHLHGKPAFSVMWFALYSARRISEITRIDWDDIDHNKRTCIIRDLKDPRKKGVTKKCKIPISAYKVILRYGNKKGRIFPYHSKTIGKYFTDACKLLGIKDLHFHDLRHAATTHLFSKGLSIQQVQQVTLHSTWQTLQRYCNLNPDDLDI
jgi:integrase